MIGVGYWGSKLKRYIEENKNINLKYICNSSFNLNQVWNDKSVTAVVVATPNETHYKIVKTALLNNKNVLSEKPLTLRTKECEELKSLSEKKKLVLHTEYTYTFSKALNKAVEWVEEGKIGQLLSVEMNIKHLGRFGGGSVYWLLGSHMLSVLDMFVPLRELDFSRKDLVVNEGEVETGIIMFDGKIHGQIIISLNYVSKDVNIILYGEYGTIIYNPLIQPVLQVTTYKRLKWTIYDKLPKKTETLARDEGNNLQYSIESFYSILKGEEKSNIETAVEITRILEKIQNSANGSTSNKLEYVNSK